MDGIIRNTSFPKKLSFRELDFFSEGASVKIKSDDRVKSTFGALLSILIYGLLTAAIYYYLVKFLDDTNPKLQNNSRLLPTPNNFAPEKGGVGGTFMFFLITNPSSDAGVTEPKYLTIKNYASYYEIKSTYTQVKSKIEGLIVKPDTSVPPIKHKVEMQSCAEAEWFKDPANQEILDANSYTKFLIKEFGLCPKFNSSMPIFGDEQTLDSGKYTFGLANCIQPACDPIAVFPIVSKSSGQSVTVGAFQPVVNNAKKQEPFEYEINMDTLVPLNLFLNSIVVVSLKELVVETDVGMFIEDVKQESRAAVNSYRISYDPVVTVGDVWIDDPNFANYYVKYVTPPVDPITITIVSSRLSQQVSRSYDTILDLIGNAGGTAEALIMILLIMFHWIENMHVDSRINSVVGKYLGLPEPIRPPLNMFNPWIRPFVKEKIKKTQLQSDEVVAEIVEKALSVEQMSYNQIMLRFFLEHSLPSEVSELIPVVYVMKELLEKHFEEERAAVASKVLSESKDKNALSPVPDSEIKNLKNKDEKNMLTELNLLKDQPENVNQALQSPETVPPGHKTRNLQAINSPKDGSTEFGRIPDPDPAVQKMNPSDKPHPSSAVVTSPVPRLPQAEVLSPGGINFQELFGAMVEDRGEPAQRHGQTQQGQTHSRKGSMDIPDVPDEPREIEPHLPSHQNLGRHTPGRNSKPNTRESGGKKVWVPFFEHLKSQGKLDGNEADLQLIERLSKQKPILLKSYQVLRGNLTLRDEHQEMRQNLFGIIEEFMQIKHLSIEDLFGKEENLDLLRESWVRPLSSARKAQNQQ